jgi:hypothetical protein
VHLNHRSFLRRAGVGALVAAGIISPTLRL